MCVLRSRVPRQGDAAQSPDGARHLFEAVAGAQQWRPSAGTFPRRPCPTAGQAAHLELVASVWGRVDVWVRRGSGLPVRLPHLFVGGGGRQVQQRIHGGKAHRGARAATARVAAAARCCRGDGTPPRQGACCCHWNAWWYLACSCADGPGARPASHAWVQAPGHGRVAPHWQLLLACQTIIYRNSTVNKFFIYQCALQARHP